MNLASWRKAFRLLRNERELDILIISLYREGLSEGMKQPVEAGRLHGQRFVLPTGDIVSWCAPSSDNDEWTLLDEAGRTLCMVTPFCDGPRGVLGWQMWAEGEFYLLLEDAMQVAETSIDEWKKRRTGRGP